MKTMTLPRRAARLWRWAALAFSVVPTLAAVVFLTLGEPLMAGAIAVSAIIFWLNFFSMRDLSRKLERRRERLDRRASMIGPDS